MKAPACTLIFLLGALLAPASGHAGEDRTITKVVKLLQRMLDTSKDDAEHDRVMYSKYKCFADTSDSTKTSSIKKLTQEVSILENNIAKLQAQNGELSDQVATLNKDVEANMAADTSATKVRSDSNKAFVAMESDLITALGQMKEALTVLKSFTLAQAQTSFLAGATQHNQGAALSSKASDALIAVSALLSPENQNSLESFLQAKTTKGSAIVKILQNLRTTFEYNLASARESETAELKAFEETIKVLESSRKLIQASLREKEGDIGAKDGELALDKSSYDTAVDQKKTDEGELLTLRDEAATKAKNFNQRKMLRVNEDAALSEAVSILNSDAAFSGFAETKATSSGKTSAGTLSFLQLRQHGGSVQFQVAHVLERGRSSRLAHMAAGLRAGNPFEKVVKEIENMKQSISDEATADLDKKTWCHTENTNSAGDLLLKNAAVLALDGELGELETTIGSNDEPRTGLMMQISDAQTALLVHQNEQTQQAQLRKEENSKFQADTKNLNEAENVLERSLQVLTKYYTTLDEKYMKAGSVELVQRSHDDPDTAGMSSLGAHGQTGNSAIRMLTFILGETRNERTLAGTTEQTAKELFDSEAEIAKTGETELSQSLVSLQGSLAQAQKQLQEKNVDLKDTTAAKNAIDDYLLSIKAGCDFIANNFDLREQNRGTETTALDDASTLIKTSPAYKSAIATV